MFGGQASVKSGKRQPATNQQYGGDFGGGTRGNGRYRVTSWKTCAPRLRTWCGGCPASRRPRAPVGNPKNPVTRPEILFCADSKRVHLRRGRGSRVSVGYHQGQ